MAAGSGWVRFLEAIVDNDLDHVRTQLGRRDLRIPLSDLMEESNALDLAAQWGHTEMVRSMLDEAYRYDEQERRRLVHRAIVACCKTETKVNMDILNLLLTELRPLIDMPLPGDGPKFWSAMFRSCLESGDVAAFHRLVEFATEVNYQFHDPDDSNSLVNVAFESGRKELLETVIKLLDFVVAGMYIPVFEIFVHCALGDVAKVREEMDTNEEWYTERETAMIGDRFFGMFDDQEEFPRMRLIGVAARFGHLNLLEMMWRRLQPMDDFIIEDSAKEIVRQAWSTDQLEIVQWLHENGGIKLQPPHCYPKINRYGRNRVFEYVLSACPDLSTLQSSVQANCHILTYYCAKSLRIIKHYLSVLPRDRETTKLLDHMFCVSMYEETPLVAAEVAKMMTMRDRASTRRAAMHALCSNDYSERMVPNLPNIEIVLREVGPQLDKQTALEWFLGYGLDYHTGDDEYEGLHPYIWYTQIKSAAILILEHGAVLEADVFKHLLKGAFYCLRQAVFDKFYVLIRVLVLTELVDVTPFLTDYSPETASPLYVHPSLLYFLVNFLRNLAGGESRTINYPGLLVSMMRPLQRRRFFIQLMEPLNLVIVDELFNHLPISFHSLPEYQELVKFTRDRIPSLKIMIRDHIHSCLRKKQTELRKRGRIIDFSTLLDEFSESADVQSLPVPLPDFFKLAHGSHVPYAKILSSAEGLGVFDGPTANDVDIELLRAAGLV